MKELVRKLLCLLLIIGTCTSFAANKILLTGRPVILIPEADYYRFPKTYSPITKYHFVDISSDNRVCFLIPQLELKHLDMLKIYIVQNEKKYLWYCYRYSPDFFTIDF